MTPYICEILLGVEIGDDPDIFLIRPRLIIYLFPVP